MAIIVPDEGERGLLQVLKNRHDNDQGHFEFQLSTNNAPLGDGSTMDDVSNSGDYNADFKGYLDQSRVPVLGNLRIDGGVAKMDFTISYYYDPTKNGATSNTCTCWWITWYEPGPDEWYLVAAEEFADPVIFDSTHHSGEAQAWTKTVTLTFQ